MEVAHDRGIVEMQRFLLVGAQKLRCAGIGGRVVRNVADFSLGLRFHHVGEKRLR